jgi:4-diphosphocytidyl-2-C-methyl-D-erythritol kinase
MSRRRGAAAGPAARVAAQCKVNLVLRVFGPDATGFHPLETLFQRLDLHDIVTVTTTQGERTLDAAGPMMPPGGLGPVEKNLAWRAAEAYALQTGFPSGWHIEIDKRIPVGGGLGGGSADAGAVLRALNEMAPHPMNIPTLQALGAKLGADVPFLAGEDALAIGRGYGERLQPIMPLPRALVLLAAFANGVNTKSAYTWLDASRDPAMPIRRLGLAPEDVRDWGDVAALAMNDFEPVVAEHHDGVADAIRYFEEAIPVASGGFTLLSGSGATVFALLPAMPDGTEFPDDVQLHGLEVDASTVPETVDVLAQTVTATRVEPVERLA